MKIQQPIFLYITKMSSIFPFVCYFSSRLGNLMTFLKYQIDAILNKKINYYETFVDDTTLLEKMITEK